MGIYKDFIVVMFYSLPLRVNIGGFHRKNYLSCLVFSISYYFLVYYLTKHINISFASLFTIGSICVITLFYATPVNQ